MGALAAAGCAWSARGDSGYGWKWAWLARRGCLHGKQLGATDGARRLHWGFVTLQFKPQSRVVVF